MERVYQILPLSVRNLLDAGELVRPRPHEIVLWTSLMDQELYRGKKIFSISKWYIHILAAIYTSFDIWE